MVQNPVEELKELAREAHLDLGSQAFAKWLDTKDPLEALREEFHYPTQAQISRANGSDKPHPEGDDQPSIYLCGNSLGLQPKSIKHYLDEELQVWAEGGVFGHHHHIHGRPWLTIDEHVLDESARIVGAERSEVAIMNTLTANVHLLMAAFYRPEGPRTKILIEAKAFPSDRYAVESQIRWHGLDPADHLIALAPRAGEDTLRTEDILQVISDQGSHIALVFFSGVQYYTGQCFDMPRITEAGHSQGCMVGFDLAHAVGNVSLQLHDWGVDFACWCTYKYLNAGPGGIAGIFVHSRHGDTDSLTQLHGWWGNRVTTRFQMSDTFDPIPGSAGRFQLSNPNVLAMVSLLGALDVFAMTDMAALRRKSRLLTGYLEYLLQHTEPAAHQVRIITPKDPEARGCQLSLILDERAFSPVFNHLTAACVVCDERKPNCIRVAPVPLYNSFADVFRFVEILCQALTEAECA
ncbi:Kynureninase (L-kynurenine hydrolase) [Tieghemiomyces parasiticus]|uniref:Kynureninase n=1 Tax=Tieghemiomyces parasiticus TaxID=78921 RepID=A0A9W8A884_9FUNG|nr:Kynureninase (L-kynurenine hydrolase) [Tieghemiomyces parasiticus]